MKKVKGHAAKAFKFLFLLGLFVASILFALFQGGFVSWFLLGSFAPLAFYSLLLFFYPIRNLKVDRILKQKEYNAGEKAEITIHISRKDWFPLFYLIIEDDVSEKLKKRAGQNFKIMFFPLFKRTMSLHYVIEKIPRGEYNFSQFILKTGDLFGFVQKETIYPAADKVLVYPSYVDLVYNPFENQFEQGMTATKDKVQRDSTMAISLRDYEPGDRFSWIHWKASARRNEIMTKEFEQRQTHDVVIVLDRTPHEAFDLSVTLATSIIRAVLKKGAEVGFYSFGAKKDFFPVQRGDFQLRTLLFHLASVEDNARLSFSKIIESEPMFLQLNRTTMFIVSELRLEDVDYISSLSKRKGNVILFVVKPQNGKTSSKDMELLEKVKRRGVIAKIVYEGEFAGVFGRGDW